MGAEHHRWVGVPAQLGRQHVNSAGKRKRSYTRARAEREAKARGCDAYRCGQCGRWHLGKLRSPADG